VSDGGYQLLEAARECFRFGLEIIPAMLPLALPSVVNVLPVVVKDHAGDVDVILGQCVHCVENLFFCQVLT
jgi:hypothetical protein